MFLLSQDVQLVVLRLQLISVALGSLQFGVQLGFDLQRDAVTLLVQQSSSLGLKMLQMSVQSFEIHRLSHCQTWEVRQT